MLAVNTRIVIIIGPNDYSIVIITAPGKDSAPWKRPRPNRPFLHQEPLLEAWQSSKSVLVHISLLILSCNHVLTYVLLLMLSWK